MLKKLDVSDRGAPQRPRPDQPSRRAAQRARSRRRILDAAMAALTEADGARVTVRDIAARAEVSPGLVMQHFGTMSDLVLEVFIEANADLDALLAAAAASARDVRERVTTAFRRLAERDLSRRHLSGRMMACAWTWSADQEARFRDSVRALTSRLVEALDDPDRPTSADAREAAAVALVAIYNVTLRRAVASDWNAEELLARMAPSIDIVLQGLAASSSAPMAPGAND